VPYGSGNDLIEQDLNKEHIHFFSCSSLIRLIESLGLSISKCESKGFESPRYNNCIRVIAERKNLKENLREKIIQKCGENFFIYGIGGDFESIILPIENIMSNIIGILDSNSQKFKEKNYPDFFQIREIIYRKEVILISSIRYFEEIKDQLLSYGISENRLVGIGEILDER